MSLFAKIDFHVLYMALMMAVLGMILPWPWVAAIAVVLIPQGVVFTSLIDDLTRQTVGERNFDWSYLLLNESVVFCLAVLCFIVGRVLH